MTYEERLNSNIGWALLEGSRHFENRRAVHLALKKIARRLRELQIPYAIVGGMALFFHGYRRFTEGVDLLVTREGLEEIHRQLEGRGYLPPFTGSKHLRDTDAGVRVEFLVTGDFPGDGKPKPVTFPDPSDVSVDMEGVRVLELPQLIELKLASGMSNAGRFKDLGDVQELIRLLDLPSNYAEQLTPYVADKYRELWQGVRENPA